MLTYRLQAALFVLTALACQSGDPAPREIAITPRLDPSVTAAPGATGAAETQRPATTPGRAYGARSAPVVPGRHATADGRFSEALVPASAHDDPTTTRFSKRGKSYEAKIGSGKSAFTWIIDTEPSNYIDLVTIKSGGTTLEPMHGANVTGAGTRPKIEDVDRVGDDIRVRFVDGMSVTLSAVGRSLKVEVVRDDSPRRGHAELDLGGVLLPKRSGSVQVFRVPYFDIASVAAIDLDSSGVRYLTAWFDTGFSNASSLQAAYPGERGRGGELRYAEVARYLNADNGMRRPIRERIWLTFSPKLEDALPSMDRPVLADRETFGDLFYVSYNCTPFADATANIEALAGMGVKDLHVWMKQWQRDGFDTGYPNAVMPPRRVWGGLDGLLELRAACGAAGYGFALHHNWLFNSVQLPGKSQLDGFGHPLTTKEGGEFLKSTAALELVDEVEGELHETFDTRGTYTDSLAASMPHVDFDSSADQWGLLRPELSDYTELLARLRSIHGSPVTSEGSLGGGVVTWGGLVDVVPGSLFIRSNPPALDHCGQYVEIIPHFALGRLHEISTRAGIGPPTRFMMPKRYSMARGFTAEERDLTQTLTALYGNAGYYWWYSQSRPGSCARAWWAGASIFGELAKPGRTVTAITYVDDRNRELELPEWIEAEHALTIGSVRLHVTWQSGDELWANLTKEPWKPRGRAESIAPMGFMAHAGGVTAAILDTKAGTIQSLESPTRRYLDGRGTLITALGITTDGAVGLERLPASEGEGWAVFPIDTYTLAVPGKGREITVDTHTVALDTSLFPTKKVGLVWRDARGVATASETREATKLIFTADEFTTHGATSIAITTAD
jgi:hypothetical protein